MCEGPAYMLLPVFELGSHLVSLPFVWSLVESLVKLPGLAVQEFDPSELEEGQDGCSCLCGAYKLLLASSSTHECKGLHFV